MTNLIKLTCCVLIMSIALLLTTFLGDRILNAIQIAYYQFSTFGATYIAITESLWVGILSSATLLFILWAGQIIKALFSSIKR